MNYRLLSSAFTTLVLATGLNGGCQSQPDETQLRDSNSNWLTACDNEHQCQDGWSCVAERCLRDCKAASDCSGSATECANLSVRADGCLSAEPGGGQCVTPCSGSAECEALNPALECIDGWCLPQPDACEDTADPTSADGGSVGRDPEPASPEPEPEPQISEPSSEPDVNPEPGSVAPAVDPDAGTGSEPSPSPVECPPIADSCEAPCHPVQDLPIDPVALCVGPQETLGCVLDTIATDDANCIRGIDGTLYASVSGTHLPQLLDSGLYERCSEEDGEVLNSELVTCGSQEPPMSVDGGTIGDVLHWGDMTNGTGCCDIFTIVRHDAALGYCAHVDVIAAVGGEAELSSAAVFEYTGDCLEFSTRTDSVSASMLTGTASVVYDQEVSPVVALITIDAVLEFPDGAPWVPASVELQLSDFRADGSWRAEGP